MVEIDEAKRLYDQGLDAYRMGDYEEALEALVRAREFYAESGNRVKEAEALNDAGVVCIQLEEWDQAKRYLDEALTIREALGERSAQGMTLGNLGMLYERMGEKEQAAQVYEQAIEIFRELGERGNEKAVARQLSGLKLKKAKFLDALEAYPVGGEEEEEAPGAQKMIRRLFRLLGRAAGGPGAEEAEIDEDVADENVGDDDDGGV
jgi:tetratricopeptide (TPR) repeat protein